MRELDYLKEKIAYLKLWQGIVVVTDISLTGWAIAAVNEAPHAPVLLAILGVVLLTAGAVVLHLRITAHIEQLGTF